MSSASMAYSPSKPPGLDKLCGRLSRSVSCQRCPGCRSGMPARRSGSTPSSSIPPQLRVPYQERRTREGTASPALLDSIWKRKRVASSVTCGSSATTPVAMMSLPSHAGLSTTDNRCCARQSLQPKPATEALVTSRTESRIGLRRATKASSRHSHSTTTACHAGMSTACICSATHPATNPINPNRMGGRQGVNSAARRGMASILFRRAWAASASMESPRSSAMAAAMPATSAGALRVPTCSLN